MFYYKEFYILNQYDFILHYIRETHFDAVEIISYNENDSLRVYPVEYLNYEGKINYLKFSINDNNYINFRRKIICENIVTPRDDWETNLNIEQLIKLNTERLNLSVEQILKKKKQNDIPKFNYGDYIWYDKKKGEIVNAYHQRNEYDIKIGRELIKNLNANTLTERVNIRKFLDKVPTNLELKSLKTEVLYKKLQDQRYNVGFHSNFEEKYLKDKDYLLYMQLKKELATRPHLKRKKEK